MSRFEEERKELVSHLRKRGIKNENVLSAIQNVERHFFVDKHLQNRAYEDCALPISKNQTISQPYTVAIMTELLDVKDGSKVLEIGTGSGYQSAILCEMGVNVCTIERYFELLQEAKKNFEKFNYNVISKIGDGSIGWKEFSPFDGIIVTAASPEIPQTLLNQLKINGNLVIPVGDLNSQNIFVIKKITDNEFEKKNVSGFKFVPLIGKFGWRE